MFDRLAPVQYDTLDDVLEPSENPGLVGHLEAQRMLLNARASNRMPHAIMLAGPRGIGKATFAFHLARHLLSGATGDSGFFVRSEPTSQLFRQVASEAHPAVLHLTRPPDAKGTGFKTVISVDEIRRIGQFLSLTAPDGAYRVVIVDPADDMRAAAANALLKNLEEPPPRTIFILICHAFGRLLPTIRSRCQVMRMEALNDQEMADALKGAGGIPANTDRSALIQRAEGSVRQAIVLHQNGGMEIISTLNEVLENPADIKTQQRLAEAISGRDKSSHFAIFNDHALSLLAGAATQATQSGHVMQAKKLADAWQEARTAISETEIYNLDQKQHALTMIGRLNRALTPDDRRM